MKTMKMLYIPKDLKNIKDRPKVYFCCHPEDFDRCFDVLAKDVMSKQKCTIWYAQDLSESRDKEYLEDLRQMQLFLMPVTSKLLDTDNIALNVEFRFATENHIPVLPIMIVFITSRVWLCVMKKCVIFYWCLVN